MTEAEWLACTDRWVILTFLRNKVSSRKLRLFACACCATVKPLLGGPALRLFEVAERFADGLASPSELAQARNEAKRAEKLPAMRLSPELARAARTARLIGNENSAEALSEAVSTLLYLQPWDRTEVLLRDIFGNPFRPVTLDPACRTPTVVSLALAAYEERLPPRGQLDVVRLSVLADALEEAGVTGELLVHLRGPGPHVRGCFAVDAALRRS
jgi:hypothetical protein